MKGEKFDLIAKTYEGLEEVLEKEIRDLGAQDTHIIRRGVRLSGDLAMMYRVNYRSRTALRVLKPVAVFRAGNENELYKGISRINWDEYLHEESTFAVEGVTSYSGMTHSHYVALKTKDAIADQFRNRTGRRPNVNTRLPDIRINVRIFKDECTVSLDSSGDSLHRRGYRTAAGPAPISEVLAAGMILLTGWNGDSTLVDPMCGSGTIPIEAALIAGGIAPGSFRKGFGFERWPGFDSTLWEHVIAEPVPRPAHPPLIMGSDMSGRILTVARDNARAAGVEDLIQWKASYFNDLKSPAPNGILIINPPYGERIRTEEIVNQYREMGTTLKHRFNGYTAWVISSDMEAMKAIGLHAGKKYKLFNGSLECRYAGYSLYEGSTREYKSGSGNINND
ncbi:MAG: RNA methyltransferase [Bacteroidales bacterium]|nr:RNA methyltransferase [Bacteroidales bacterium]